MLKARWRRVAVGRLRAEREALVLRWVCVPSVVEACLMFCVYVVTPISRALPWPPPAAPPLPLRPDQTRCWLLKSDRNSLKWAHARVTAFRHRRSAPSARRVIWTEVLAIPMMLSCLVSCQSPTLLFSVTHHSILSIRSGLLLAYYHLASYRAGLTYLSRVCTVLVGPPKFFFHRKIWWPVFVVVV